MLHITPSLHETQIEALLLRGLEEQSTAWIRRALEQSRPREAARVLARFGVWYSGLFLSVIDASAALRVFRELPVQAQAAILREIKPADTRRLLSHADFGERSFYLSLLDAAAAEQISGDRSASLPCRERCGASQ